MKDGIEKCLPMYQDAPTAIEALLDKSICGGEVLQQIFILHVIDLDEKMLIWADQVSIYWKTMHGEDMRYVCFLELQFAPQRVDSTRTSASGHHRPTGSGGAATHPLM